MANAVTLIKLGSTVATEAARDVPGIDAAGVTTSADGVLAAVDAAPRGLPEARSFDTPVTGLSDATTAAFAQARCTRLAPATRVTPGARRSR